MRDISFNHRIRAKPEAPIRKSTATVNEAIDTVYGLPDEVAQKQHWQDALMTLWGARDVPEDLIRLGEAEISFSQALAAEGWLGDLTA